MAGNACLPRKRSLRWLPSVATCVGLIWAASAHAQIGSARYSSIVVDAATGNVLEDVNADQPRHPASLTKMMTLYMTFEALRDRRISLDDTVPVTGHAASMEPTKLGLVPGTRLTVEEAILGLITKSANDAAAALGEFLGGSEDRFAQMMTLRARALGMSRTTFGNASGLPDPDQWTTARDLAILARHLINDFPSYYRYFSVPSFTWHRRVIFNHDNMLRTYPGADGLKTGYTVASGHNLVTSAVRGGVRLIGVVLGAGSNSERDIHMAALLDQSFTQMDVPIGRRTAPQPRMMLIASARAAEAPARPQALPQPPAQAARLHQAAWTIQVGAFGTQAAARTAAANARRLADGGDIRVEPVTVKRKPVYRAQVVGLRPSDAQEACTALNRRKTPCVIIKPVLRDVASR
ncbi:D-alanyl-D-alanine carboxypeptidase family protein [Rhodopila sp.]|uniref:D-alanyl-D-alanine carboxypeptidase family protein n=1 Tax=Rhodopila sp. TaxID=2480087 RepID=UPI002D05DC15|nr:D-alanyl-D-alanine carboxypeptidase family protein [Rhodopila sp.]HVZ07249.1 D-alanyl-D-alanine carboxypeptidase family protein [Rhodopila sp.]